MRWLRLVVGVAVVWVMSLVVTFAGMEVARQIVLVTESRAATQAARLKASALSARDQVGPVPSSLPAH